MGGALFVAEHGDAAGGEALGQVAEGLDGADGLIAIAGAGALHQHHGRKRAVAVGQSQGAGKLPFVVADGDGALVEGSRIAVGGPLPGGAAGNQKQAGDEAVAVDNAAEIDGLFGEFDGDDDDGVRSGGLLGGLANFSDISEGLDLHAQLGHLSIGEGLLHIRREHRGQFGVAGAEERIERLPRGRGRVRRRLGQQQAGGKTAKNSEKLHVFILSTRGRTALRPGAGAPGGRI